MTQQNSHTKSRIAKQKLIEYLQSNDNEKVVSSVELSKQLNIDSKRCSDFLQFLEVVRWIQFEGRKYRLFNTEQLYLQKLKFEQDIQTHKMYEDDINTISFKNLAQDVLYILYKGKKKMSVKQLAIQLKKESLNQRITEILLCAKACEYIFEEQRLYYWNDGFFDNIRQKYERQHTINKLRTNSFDNANHPTTEIFSPQRNQFNLTEADRSQLSQQINQWFLSQDVTINAFSQ